MGNFIWQHFVLINMPPSGEEEDNAVITDIKDKAEGSSKEKGKSSYKDGPPVFDENRETWKQFKKKLNLWEALTPLKDTEKGSIVYLSLKGKAEEIVRNLSEKQIRSKNEYSTIVNALDAVGH